MTFDAMRLVAGGSSLFVVFGGLFWWRALAITSHFALSFDKYISPKAAGLEVRILNRTSRKIAIEGISVLHPLSLLANDHGEPCGAEIVPGDEDELDLLQYSKTYWEIGPNCTCVRTIVVCRLGHFQANERIVVKLHIRASCPLLRHVTKPVAVALPGLG